MGKGLNIHFSEIDVHMANAREKGLNITDHQGNAINTTVRFTSHHQNS